MVRARNEGELLAAAVHSIAHFVDEVVIIDNGSSDDTPEVIRALAHELPAVRGRSYPHQVARAGQENLAVIRAADSPSDRRLSSYSNWALRQCRYPFVLKWDADMVAAPELLRAWEEWRSGPYLSMRFKGLNAHPDRVHLLAAQSRDPSVVGRPLTGDVVPAWALQMTQSDAETRLFPRFLARFDDSLWWWCESLRSPFKFGVGPPSGRFARRYKLEVTAPLYLHLKYWKRSPHANDSPDIEAMIEENMAVGPPLPETWREIVAERGLLGG
jgi:glycosyltransferase involved in cell wall biosynthesis